jgi:ornithine carbamoyltransferase
VSHPRHFLDLALLEPDVLRDIVELGRAFKSGAAGSEAEAIGRGRTLAMIFEKPSTRTRVSFEVGMKQLGGGVVVLTPTEMQIGRGETIADTARVLSRYVDAIMMRTVDADRLNDLAKYATVPVINGLTSTSHPCQLMADVMTFEERLGPIAGRTIAWSGDGNNMACTWIQAAARFGFELRLACPEMLAPPAAVIEWARDNGATISQTLYPEEAVLNADCVVTDTWVSMGDEDGDHRHNVLGPYRVDDRLMSMAKPEAIFMHCLPAHREEEVTASVMDGPRSVVWDEAENRLHAQKGILSWCMTGA